MCVIVCVIVCVIMCGLFFLVDNDILIIVSLSVCLPVCLTWPFFVFLYFIILLNVVFIIIICTPASIPTGGLLPLARPLKIRICS